MEDATRKFTALDSKAEMKEILSSVYNSLMVKGYNPINQIVGYILSEDPTYITSYNNARTLICRIDRDELMILAPPGHGGEGTPAAALLPVSFALFLFGELFKGNEFFHGSRLLSMFVTGIDVFPE